MTAVTAVTPRQAPITTSLAPFPETPTGQDGLSGFLDTDGIMLSHTPPTHHGPSSYEASSTKRPRAGSVSGRLRCASDLEDRGIIDAHEKGILKDLIISGDERLQTALDRFESGDPSELEVSCFSVKMRE